MKLFGWTAVIGGITLGFSQEAWASTTVGNTGQGSVQVVTNEYSSTTTETTTNVVEVVNTNIQVSTTGDAVVESNTSVGSVASGSSSNQNSTSTTIGVGSGSGAGNGCASGQACGEQPGGSGSGNTPGQNGGAGQPSTSNGGSVLGASTTATYPVGGQGAGAATLPTTGPTNAVDVSSLRNAWREPVSRPTVVNETSRETSRFLMMLASVLALMGAAGSAVAARRSSDRV